MVASCPNLRLIYANNPYLYIMNFLAHIFLSGPPGEVMVGNFMADSVKGNSADNYARGIRDGIKLHRAIDAYTDAHPTVLRSKERLRQKFGKYAPVVADVYYDHFLARGWSQFSEISLRDYTHEIYSFLKDHYAVFPLRTQRFYDYMTQYDILFSYSEVEGIDRVMKGMARRARFESGMERSAEELLANYAEYEKEFHLFFPDLQQHMQSLHERGPE